MAETERPFTIWSLDAPMNKRGVPVMGNFGGRWRRVIVIEADTWNRMCDAMPDLRKAHFRVGSYDDDVSDTPTRTQE